MPGVDGAQADTLQLVSRWLADENNGSWLLVLGTSDDASVFFGLQPLAEGESMASVQAQRPLIDCVPQTQHGIVLITTRDQASAQELTGDYGALIGVESMDLAEFLDLLKIKLPDAGTEATVPVKKLECVPLAISQAGAYIHKSNR